MELLGSVLLGRDESLLVVLGIVQVQPAELGVDLIQLLPVLLDGRDSLRVLGELQLVHDFISPVGVEVRLEDTDLIFSLLSALLKFGLEGGDLLGGLVERRGLGARHGVVEQLSINDLHLDPVLVVVPVCESRVLLTLLHNTGNPADGQSLEVNKVFLDPCDGVLDLSLIHI